MEFFRLIKKIWDKFKNLLYIKINTNFLGLKSNVYTLKTNKPKVLNVFNSHIIFHDCWFRCSNISRFWLVLSYHSGGPLVHFALELCRLIYAIEFCVKNFIFFQNHDQRGLWYTDGFDSRCRPNDLLCTSYTLYQIYNNYKWLQLLQYVNNIHPFDIPTFE
jgi:hypothetical protein